MTMRRIVDKLTLTTQRWVSGSVAIVGLVSACVASNGSPQETLATVGEATCSPHCPPPTNTDWLKDARYGVFIHFIPGMNDITADGSADWNSSVNSFDVSAFTDQVVQTGARYVIMTLGQDSGYYCSPNATLDSYAGSGLTSTRDLPLEVSAALAGKGIKLMVYMPANSPENDTAPAPAVAAALGSTERYKNPDDPDDFQNGNYVYTPTFRDRWSQVIQEWSDRFGPNIVGWWFDGAYGAIGFDQSYATAFAAAARHGNPRSVVAFDQAPDTDNQTAPQYVGETFTTGELNLAGLDSYQYPTSRVTNNNTEWHGLSFLGASWGDPSTAPGVGGIRDPLDPLVAMNYINDVNARGGAFTMDMAVFKNGSFAVDQLSEMAFLKQSLRDARTVPHISTTVTSTSEESGYEATNTIDTDESSIWSTRFSPTVDALPQSLTYYLGDERELTRLRYLPRLDQSVSMNGNITSYSIYTSQNGLDFVLLQVGTWPDSGDEKSALIDHVKARYLKLVAEAGHGGLAAASNINIETVSPPQPVLYYQLNEASGPLAFDTTIDGTVGLVVGPTWAAGKHGGALHFDGLDDWLLPTSSSTLDISGPVSLAAWVRTDANIGASGEFDIIARGSRKSPTSADDIYLRISDSNYQIGSWDGSTTAFASYPIQPGDHEQWTHLVGVYDGTRWVLYKNGVDVAEEVSGVGAPSTDSEWGIGSNSSGTARFYQGDIDDVRIYNRALSADDVVRLYNDIP